MEGQVESNDNEILVVDYQAVAEGIRSLPANTHIPFVAATVDLGLMNPPTNLVREKHMHLSRFDVMVIILKNHPSTLPQFMEQTAAHADQGVFPEGEGQQGWNDREFGQVIGLLTLLTNNPESSIVKESNVKEPSNDETESG
jgi:hypothetical protein